MGNNSKKCAPLKPEEKESHPPPDPCPRPPEPVSNSPLVELLDSSSKTDLPPELVPVLPSTSLPFLSTSPLRFSSSLVTPPRTPRRPESSQDTSNSLSETMRNSTDSLRMPPSLPVVFSLTSTLLSSSLLPPRASEIELSRLREHMCNIIIKNLFL